VVRSVRQTLGYGLGGKGGGRGLILLSRFWAPPETGESGSAYQQAIRGEVIMASKIAATPREETVEEFLARGGHIKRIEAHPDPDGRVLLRGQRENRQRFFPAFSTHLSTETPVGEERDAIRLQAPLRAAGALSSWPRDCAFRAACDRRLTAGIR
jgi:hypothetical protein